MTYCWLLATEEDLEKHGKDDNSNQDQDSNGEVGLFLSLLNYIICEKQKEHLNLDIQKATQLNRISAKNVPILQYSLI
jgi:hypothetical protein